MKPLDLKSLLIDSRELAKAHPEQVREHKTKEPQMFINSFVEQVENLAQNSSKPSVPSTEEKKVNL